MGTQRSKIVNYEFEFFTLAQAYTAMLNANHSTFEARCKAIENAYKVILSEEVVAAALNDVRKKSEELKEGLARKIAEIQDDAMNEHYAYLDAVKKHELNLRQYAAEHIQTELANALNHAFKRARKEQKLSATEEKAIKELTKNFDKHQYTKQIEIINSVFDHIHPKRKSDSTFLHEIFGPIYETLKPTHSFSLVLQDCIEATRIGSFVQFEEALFCAIDVSIDENHLDTIGKPIVAKKIEDEKDAVQSKIEPILMSGIPELNKYQREVIADSFDSPDKLFDEIEEKLVKQAVGPLRIRAEKALEINNNELSILATARDNLRHAKEFLPPAVAKLPHPALKDLAERAIKRSLLSHNIELPSTKTKKIILDNTAIATKLLRRENADITSKLELINRSDTDWRVAKKAMIDIDQHIKASQKAIRQSDLLYLQERIKEEISEIFAPIMTKLKMIAQVLEHIKAETDRLKTRKGIFLFETPGADKAKRIDAAIDRALRSPDFAFSIMHEDIANCVECLLTYRLDDRGKIMPSVRDALQENRGLISIHASNAYETVLTKITGKSFVNKR